MTEESHEIDAEVPDQLIEHGFATQDADTVRLTSEGEAMLDAEIRRSTEQPVIEAGGETFYSAWESGPEGSVEYPAGRMISEALAKAKAEDKYDVNGFLV